MSASSPFSHFRGDMDEQLEAICRYLDGQKLMSRADDPRRLSRYLRDVVQPKLDRLAELEAQQTKKAK